MNLSIVPRLCQAPIFSLFYPVRIFQPKSAPAVLSLERLPAPWAVNRFPVDPVEALGALLLRRGRGLLLLVLHLVDGIFVVHPVVPAHSLPPRRNPSIICFFIGWSPRGS